MSRSVGRNTSTSPRGSSPVTFFITRPPFETAIPVPSTKCIPKRKSRAAPPCTRRGPEAFVARGRYYGYFGLTPALLRLPFAAFDFGISFGFDRALFEDDVSGSLAWAQALGAAGVLTADDTRAIVTLAKRYQQNALRIRTAGEDRGHADIEYRVVRIAGNKIERTRWRAFFERRIVSRRLKLLSAQSDTCFSGCHSKLSSGRTSLTPPAATAAPARRSASSSRCARTGFIR